MLHRFAIAVATAAASLALLAPAAPAAKVLLGTRTPESLIFFANCVQACTFTPTAIPGAVAASPVDGTIVRWRIFGATVGKTYRLRVLTPEGGAALFSGSGTSAGIATDRTSEFDAALPIKAGQRIGVDLEPDGRIAISPPGVAGETLTFRPPLGENVTAAGLAGTGEMGLQAEVQRAPTITSIDPATGSVQGENSVVIEGTELQGATSVKFGSTPAVEFFDSETQITAVAPRAAAAAAVPISVTTPAGTATSPADYVYTAEREEPRGDGNEDGGGAACVVPKLKGKKLKGSKKRLRAAGCRIGKVRKRAGATARKGRVAKQSPKPGKRLPPGTKVNVTLR
jgi:hypothetical protein